MSHCHVNILYREVILFIVILSHSTARIGLYMWLQRSGMNIMLTVPEINVFAPELYF